MRTRRHIPAVYGHGFTLIEAIIVIVLTGILAAAVAVFLRAPVQAYLDVARRAELTDIADTALRRIGRDLRQALPNSIRVTAGNTAIEFIPVKTAGRYREALTNAGSGDPLDFSDPLDSSFDVIGPTVDIENGDSIVVYNLGIPGDDAYAGTNRRMESAFGTGLSVVNFSGGQFPFSSPARRFHVVGTPASYICAGGVLTRYWNYNFGVVPPAGNSGVLASHVSGCRFTYEPGVTAQNSLVTLELAITKDDETVSLVQQVHVSNVP
ncbi:MAG TPA: type II secretion system protein [Burkholderiales bacterium]|jgi:MSHA biogenesis protein MshO|nr:type II secretion system protein [Burkholderiales bacterium]